MSNHDWTDDDNIISLYLYRFPHQRTARSISSIAESLDIPAGSIKRKIGNFEYLDTDGKSGLSGYSNQAERIYKQFRNFSDDEFLTIAETAMGKANIVVSSLVNKYSPQSIEALESKIRRTEAELQRKKEQLETLKGR